MGAIDITGMPIDVLREVVRLVQNPSPATFSATSGVTCPVCRASLSRAKNGPGLGVTRTAPWIGNNRERWHTCPVCGKRFKSVEGF